MGSSTQTQTRTHTNARCVCSSTSCNINIYAMLYSDANNAKESVANIVDNAAAVIVVAAKGMPPNCCKGYRPSAVVRRPPRRPSII